MIERFYYNQNGAYFITICVKDKHELLNEIDVDAVGVGDAACSVPIVHLSDIGERVKEHLEKMNKIVEFAVLEKYVNAKSHSSFNYDKS